MSEKEKLTSGPWRVVDTLECHNGWNGPERKSEIVGANGQRIAKLDGRISKADARVIEQGTSMYSPLGNVRDYLSKLSFWDMDMQLTNECWIELIEKELRNVRG